MTESEMMGFQEDLTAKISEYAQIELNQEIIEGILLMREGCTGCL